MSSTQPINAAVTANIIGVVLEGDLAPNGVAVAREALDVPGKADAAVGDASASSIDI